MQREVKFSKFDNTPWGFRLHGGTDYGTPLTVVKVKGGSLADRTGLQVHDELVKINDMAMIDTNHEEAHEMILRAGNNFVLTVSRSRPTTPSCFPDLLADGSSSLLDSPVKQLKPLYPTQVVSSSQSSDSFVVKPVPNHTGSVTSHEESSHVTVLSEFQTIKQLEWKKAAPKLCPEDNIIGKGTRIDLIEIEKSAVDQAKSIVESRIIKARARETPPCVDRPKSVSFDRDRFTPAFNGRPKSQDSEGSVVEERCRSVRSATQSIEETIRHEQESIIPRKTPTIFAERPKSTTFTQETVLFHERPISACNGETCVIEERCQKVRSAKEHIEETIKHEQETIISRKTPTFVERPKSTTSFTQERVTFGERPQSVCSDSDSVIEERCRSVREITEHMEEVVKHEKETIQEIHKKNERVWWVGKVNKNELNITEEPTPEEIVEQNMESVRLKDLTSKHEKVTLEQAQSSAVAAAETLSQQTKCGNLTVPCIVSNVQQSTETDTILKTFFVHLTDVMVALNQMINSRDDHSCHCGPKCECIKNYLLSQKGVVSESTATLQSSELIRKVSEVEERQSSIVQKIDVKKSSGDKTPDGVLRSPSMEELGSEARHLIKDVMKETLGVDITVNGKDAVEWLNDLEQNKVAVEEVQTNEEALSAAETVVKKVVEEATSQVLIKEEETIQKVEEEVAVKPEPMEVKEEISEIITRETMMIKEEVSTEQITSTITEQVAADLSPEEFTEVKREIFEASPSPQSPIKDLPSTGVDPATPTAYIFRLDVKWKGKLAPASEPIDEPARVVPEEPTVREDLSIVRKPNWRLGDIIIESRTSTRKDPDTDRPPIRPTTLDLTSACSKREATTNMIAASAVTTNTSQILTNPEPPLSPKALALQRDVTLDSTSASLLESKQQIQETKMAELSSMPVINGEVKSEAESQAITEKEETVNVSQEVSNINVEAAQETTNIYSEAIQNGQIEAVDEICAIQAKTKEAAEKVYATIESRRSSKLTEESSFNLSETYSSFTSGINLDDPLSKPGLTDQEIAGIISGEAEVLRDQHVIGVDFNKMKPQLDFIRHSEVFKAINEDFIKARADMISENHKDTTFLQKPNRPIPFCRKLLDQQSAQGQYKVVIRRPSQKDSEDFGPGILSEGVFLVPELPILVPEPEPEYLEAPEYLPDSEFPDLEDTGIPLPPEAEEPEPTLEEIKHTLEEDQRLFEEQVALEQTEPEIDKEDLGEVDWVNGEMDERDLELPVEDQLLKVQKQLEALSKLPAAIQMTLDIVTKQLVKMVPTKTEEKVESKVEEVKQVEEKISESVKEVKEEKKEEEEQRIEQVTTTVVEEKKTEETVIVKEEKHTVKTEEIVCSLNGEQKINKCKKDVISELEKEHMCRAVKMQGPHKSPGPKPQFGPLVPQQRPLVLPGGRKWKGPKDTMTDAYIAETLSGQAEIITGTTLGNRYESAYLPFDDRESNCMHVAILKEGTLTKARVNFMKYKKPPINMDMIKNSPVYKMVHDMDNTSHLPIEDRPPITFAECDYREKCRSMTPSSMQQLSI